MMIMMKKCGCKFVAAIMLAATVAGQAGLRVDFSPTGLPVQPGFQGYFAVNAVGTSFTTQSFSAFGTTVYVAPTWAPGAVNAAKRMVDRGGNDGTDAGTRGSLPCSR